MFSGRVHTLDLPITQRQLNLYYNDGALIQNAFPHLSNPDREFIKTGITAEEWLKEFGRIIGEINVWERVCNGSGTTEVWRCSKTGKTITIE